MNSNYENNYQVEKSSEECRWTLAFKSSVEEAKSHIGSAQHWRITDRSTEKVIAQSEGELPEIFTRDHNAATLVEGAHKNVGVRTITQTKKERLINA